MTKGLIVNIRPMRGFSLINLMIGLLISSISMLAMLGLYKNMVQHSASSLSNARQDGQQALGLLTAQLELQGAGFGIKNPDIETELIIFRNARFENNIITGGKITLSTETSSVDKPFAILWKMHPDIGSEITTYDCAGLFAPSDGGLLLLRSKTIASTGSCNSVQWDKIDQVSLIAQKNVYTQNILSLRLTAKIDTCWPFGKGQTKTSPIINIESPTSLHVDPEDEDTEPQPFMLGFSICLSNFEL